MSTILAVVSNGSLIAILGHALIAASLVWDKVLLKRPNTQNLLSYVFWLGGISVFGLLLIPFGFSFPGARISGMAFAAGVLNLAASYFYYAALKAGEASEELALMGGFAPVATALIALPLLNQPLMGDAMAFILLTAGGFVMFSAEKMPLKRILPKVLLASTGFGMMSVLQRMVYDRTNFVSGYVFFTLGTFCASMALLFAPKWRRRIFEDSAKAPPRSKFWYMVNRFTAGAGSFLVLYAVSRTSPVLVSAISGIRYVIIFVAAYAITRWRPSWFRENFAGWAFSAKLAGTCLIVAGLALLG